MTSKSSATRSASLLLTALFCVVFHSDAVAVSRNTLDVNGTKRSYLLHTPGGIETGKSYPLVIVLHGGGGTARGLYRDTRKSFSRLAEAHGFFIAYPNAVKRTWDFGSGKVSEALTVRTDDHGFFKQLLDHLIAKLPIDRNRVFATGISRGGQASYFMACQFPTRIRAIAPIAMPLPQFMAASCAKTPNIGLVVINGTDDPIVPYHGGKIIVRGRDRGKVLSTESTLERWLTNNGCQGEPTASRTINPVDDGTKIKRLDWTNCSGAPVRLLRIEGGGHTWPSGSQYLPERVVGKVTRDIDGAVEAWSFFSMFK